MSGTPVTPAPSRTIVLAVPNPPADLLLRWMPKSPGTTQDYSLDFTAWAEEDDEVVTSFTAVVSVAGDYTLPLVSTPAPLNPAYPNVCTTILSGGASVTDCAVTFTAQTATRTLQLSCWIVVSNLSATTDRYGNRAVIASATDPSTQAQISALTQSLATETAARIAAVAALNTAIAGFAASLTSETARAETEESSLQISVTALATMIDSLIASSESLMAVAGATLNPSLIASSLGSWLAENAADPVDPAPNTIILSGGFLKVADAP